MIGYIILGLVALFFAVILIRTLTFKPKAQPAISNEEVKFDSEAAVHALSELVKCKTISYNDHALEDDVEFQKLINMLPTLYPKVFEVCSFEQLPDVIWPQPSSAGIPVPEPSCVSQDFSSPSAPDRKPWSPSSEP